MMVINDLCGDEDDAYLWCEYFKLHMHEVVYKEFLSAFKVPAYSTKISDVVVDQPTRYVSFTVEVK